ncbi:MAG: Sporulation kinase A [Smithella sp. PtaU1.Bin162]|nr:MAG: Sporulation kinase A [Smithella sp. PtaU1.Bin162]
MEDITLLQQSFESFNKATLDLQRAYGRLEERFAGLNKELEEKNNELVKTVEEKEQTKNYLQNILESLINGVVVTDLDGKIQTMNQCAEVFTNVYQTKAFGQHISILFEDIAVNDWPTINLAEYFKGESGHKVKINGRVLEIFCSPFKSPVGASIGNVFILRDITRIEKLEDMAKRTEKFAAMGEMAANIAHEIRNPLGSIELFASLLLKNLQEKKDRERVVQIISSVKNVDNKISNLLMFTRKQNPKMEKIDVQQALTEVLNFSEQIMEQGDIDVSAVYVDDQMFIEGDAEMIKQVFLNIILNAQQSMPDGGILSIKSMTASAGIMPGEASAAEIIFQDSGTGIPEENLSRIFDPFFSTKEGGAGLGLAIVHNIVSQHKGSITVENSPQGGTKVSISFPLLKEITAKLEKTTK